MSNETENLKFLPNPNIGVINAKYTIENFVMKNMRNTNQFLGNFESYSIAVMASIATVVRAMNHVLITVKVS